MKRIIHTIILCSTRRHGVSSLRQVLFGQRRDGCFYVTASSRATSKSRKLRNNFSTKKRVKVSRRIVRTHPVAQSVRLSVFKSEKQCRLARKLADSTKQTARTV